jgi:hypothetical protein
MAFEIQRADTKLALAGLDGLAGLAEWEMGIYLHYAAPLVGSLLLGSHGTTLRYTTSYAKNTSTS